MQMQTKWLAMAVLAMGASVSDAAITAGNVKAVNADEQTIVLTDAGAKDWTLSLGKQLIVNRDGKEGPAALKVGDKVQVCYEKGVAANTAHYILVQSGSNAGSELSSGSVKTFDGATKKLTWTDEAGTDWTYPINGAKLRRNQKETQDTDIKIGDAAMVMTKGAGAETEVLLVILAPK